VTRLRQMVDESPTGKITDTDLRGLGIDPSTARRQFTKYYGMTFQAYHRARRMGMALTEIRKGESIIGAQIDTGFESASGFWEAFKQVFGTPPSAAAQTGCLLAQWIDTPLGSMVALGNDDGIHLFEFTDRRGLENEITRLRKRFKCAIVPGSNHHLEKFCAEVKAYFDGTSLTFSVPMIVSGTQFEKAVWAQLQTIPPGETRSYSDIAKNVGSPGAVRAVGRANGRNSIAIAIPCHRVIRADGDLCGYGGGVWRKKWLLEHEQQIVAPGGTNLTLFDRK
jgi:AraC family transcriptional regulator of adaptative response/methylated-DNA-[protein]-cysteine methyltransferase